MTWMIHEFHVGLGLMFAAMVLGSIGAASAAKKNPDATAAVAKHAGSWALGKLFK